MAVEGHVLKFIFLFEAVLVRERGHQFAFAAHAEIVDLDLVGEIDAVLRDHLVHGFLGAPVDGELLVALLLVDFLDLFELVFGKGFLLDGGEVAVERLAVDAHFVGRVEDDGDVAVGVGDADIHR